MSFVSVAKMFETHAAMYPKRFAAMDLGTAPTTYGQLHTRARQVADLVHDALVGPGQVVGLACRRGVEGLVGMLGVLLAGAAYVYLDPDWPRMRLELVARQCRLPLILADAAGSGSVLDLGCPVTRLDNLLDRPRGGGGYPEPGPQDPAYVVYTSGSTGTPKGVVAAHGSVANMVSVLREQFMLYPGVKMAQFSAWPWDAAVCEILTTLSAGSTLVMVPEKLREGGPDLADFLRSTRVSVATLTPSVWAALPEDRLPMLRTVVAVGEPCPGRLVNRWAPDRRFLNGYGPTEATVAVSLGHCYKGQRVTIGRPIPGVKVRVVDEHDKDVPEGESGELVVGGRGVALGYLAEPVDGQLTIVDGGKFFTDENGERWYRTGDVVSTEEGSGRLVFEGRRDHQVQLHGWRIELAEVEHAIEQHPAVQRCVVVATAHRLVAWVQSSDPLLMPADLVGVAASQLPSHEIPSEYHIVGVLPTTVNGKLDREALRTATPEHSDVAELVLTFVRAELGEHSFVGGDDDLVEMGTTSLFAAQLAVQLSEELGFAVDARMIVEGRTAARIGEEIRRAMLTRVGG